MKNVLVVPDIKKNLVSVGKLAKDNACTVTFDANNFYVKSFQGNVLAKGHRSEGLYAFDKNHEALAVFKGVSQNTWHQRMGHPNFNYLKILHSKNLINISSWEQPKTICASCQMGKSCKLSFSLTNKIANFPLDKLHCDLWGPAPILSCQNFKYYAIIVDDCTRYTWIFPLKQKSDFFEVFTKFQKQVENLFERKIKIFQSDGGGEFTSIAFENHLSNHGIYHQFSCPHTPQ